MIRKKKIRGLQKQESEAVNEFCTGVRKALGSNLVGLKLFGSKARGEGTRNSDLDIAVVVRQRNAGAWDRIMDIAFDVNLKWAVYISPRVLESCSLRDPKWRVTGFVKNLQREGIPL